MEARNGKERKNVKDTEQMREYNNTIMLAELGSNFSALARAHENEDIKLVPADRMLLEPFTDGVNAGIVSIPAHMALKADNNVDLSAACLMLMAAIVHKMAMESSGSYDDRVATAEAAIMHLGALAMTVAFSLAYTHDNEFKEALEAAGYTAK